MLGHLHEGALNGGLAGRVGIPLGNSDQKSVLIVNLRQVALEPFEDGVRAAVAFSFADDFPVVPMNTDKIDPQVLSLRGLHEKGDMDATLLGRNDIFLTFLGREYHQRGLRQRRLDLGSLAASNIKRNLGTHPAMPAQFGANLCC